MNVTRRSFLGIGAGATVAGLGACAQFSWPVRQPGETPNSGDGSRGSAASSIDLDEFKALALHMDAWSYSEPYDCYYQMGVPYCLSPATKAYESLAIFVPGAYFTGKKGLGGSYTCEINPEGKLGSFTARTAPIAMPINSSRFEAQACPTSFSYAGISRYLTAGFIYVYAGFRGRSATAESGTNELIAGGAPWPVVDLKAAVRYVRYNKDVLPGDTSRIFMFGFGGGGGIAACLGAMGDAPIFDPYLLLIGAATHDGTQGEKLSDAIYGAATWCPLTSFDAADASYEWMMGQFAHDGQRAKGTWTRRLSRDLAGTYGGYINHLGLADEKGTPLSLDETSTDDYVSGSYYDYILGLIESSAGDFLGSTSFPYTFTPHSQELPLFPGDPNLTPSMYDSVATATDAAADAASGGDGADATTDASAVEGVTTVQSTVYDSVESYVASLNNGPRWLIYSTSAQKASVTDLWDFVTACRPASRGVAAFDAYDRSAITNQLFGIGEETSLHYDATVADLVSSKRADYSELKDWKDDYVDDWMSDLAKTDAQGFDMSQRVQMMNPLFCLNSAYTGYGSSSVAPHWRINSGLFSSVNALTDEVNLALALKAYDGVKDVALNVVWAAGFELAEKSGSAEANLVAWMSACCEETSKNAEK